MRAPPRSLIGRLRRPVKQGIDVRRVHGLCGDHTLVAVEKEQFPRYHVGESLMPFCYFPLERLKLVDTLMESKNPRKYCVQFVKENGEGY